MFYYPNDPALLPKEKSSFKDFFQSNFKSSKNFLKSYSTRPSSHIPRASTQGESIKQQSHHILAARTWDANHMNAFINNNNYAEKAEPFTTFSSLKTHKTTISTKNTDNFMEFPYKSEAFSDRYSPINHLVTDELKDIPSAPEFYKKFIEKPINNDKNAIFLLNGRFEGKTERLSASREKRENLQLLKQNLQQFHENQSQIHIRTKRYRILKQGYKSGVLCIDHPENQYTELYRPEYLTRHAKMMKKEITQEKHRKYIENNTKTDKNIVFSNRNYEKPVFFDKSEPKWDKKHKPSDNFMSQYVNSYQRVFGNNPGEWNKRLWLRAKEDRKVNIISFKKEH